MKVPRLPRLARALPPALAVALVLAASCSAQGVKGFAWKTEDGTSLPFTQGASWPEGAEGRFGPGRQSNTYSLKKNMLAPADTALVVCLRRPSPEPELQVKLSLNFRSNGPSPLEAFFPLLSDRVFLVLPLERGSRIASLSLSSQRIDADFSVESIAIAPSFKGIDRADSGLKVSAGFSLIQNGGGQELSIEKPFHALAEGALSKGSLSREGLLLEYGPCPPDAVIRMEAVDADGKTRRLSLRTHPGGTRTALDRSLFPAGTQSMRLQAPRAIEIKAFFAGELSAPDFELADLGRVLDSREPSSDYSVYRWDLLPSVLVFDFKDYATQDSYLKRLAFFVEKIGFRGRLATDEEMAALHGWNAHDYRSEDLAAFFRAAKERSFPLGKGERDLEAVLVREGVIVENGGRAEPGRGAMISIARESGPALRWLFTVHESTHGVFFTDGEYRDFSRSLWSSLDKSEKWFWTTYLGWAGYDVGSDYLMGNEFQAYLLQQPAAAAEEYFSKRKSAELLEKHPELTERTSAYMAEFGGRFADHARQLEAWLYKRYGIEAGRTAFLSVR